MQIESLWRCETILSQCSSQGLHKETGMRGGRRGRRVWCDASMRGLATIWRCELFACTSRQPIGIKNVLRCHKQQHYITHIYTQTHAVWENKQCGTISLRSVDTMSYKTQQASNSGHQDSQSMLRMYLRCQTQQHHHKIHTHTKHTPRGEINNVGQYHCDSFTTQRASNSGWKRTKKGVGLDNGELGSWQIWCVYCLV